MASTSFSSSTPADPASAEAVSAEPAPVSAWADGLGTFARDGAQLDAWFPHPSLGEPPAGRSASNVPAALLTLAHDDDLRSVRVRPVHAVSKLDEPITGVGDAYLRLHLLSHRLVRPNTVNLEGIFTWLPNNAWTARGPILLEHATQLLPRLRRAGVEITGIDRFPRLLDYVIPEGVRIADGARVRLGAHLAAGTVVMHEGFVNYNAGTLGRAMVEGRISQGVVVGDGSDVGGGASIMGTLSGGGNVRVRIGSGALVGANAGIGISLGDDSVVEAGLYVTAGTKVTVGGDDAAPHRVKAIELSGVPNLLFRRNSVSGAVEAIERSGAGIALNPTLHR